jgi:hypothetical protein
MPSYRRGIGEETGGIEAGAKVSSATVSSEEETVGGEEMLTTRACVSAWCEGEREVPVRWKASWAAGSFLFRAETVPLALFSFFSFSLLFLFLFSYSLYILFKFDSNQKANFSRIQHSNLEL